MISCSYLYLMSSFINRHVSIPLNKMMLQKKKHRYLIETTRSLLLSSKVPSAFLGRSTSNHCICHKLNPYFTLLDVSV